MKQRNRVDGMRDMNSFWIEVWLAVLDWLIVGRERSSDIYFIFVDY